MGDGRIGTPESAEYRFKVYNRNAYTTPCSDTKQLHLTHFTLRLQNHESSRFQAPARKDFGRRVPGYLYRGSVFSHQSIDTITDTFATAPKRPLPPAHFSIGMDQPGQGQIGSRSSNRVQPIVIAHLGPNDVLIGRGSPATANIGNIRFREVIRSLLPMYVATTRRSEKDRIARRVIEIVQSRQGRFVRRVESPAEADSLDLESPESVWILVGDEVVIPKVKQTFRDQHAESTSGQGRAGRMESDHGQQNHLAPFGVPYGSLFPPSLLPFHFPSVSGLPLAHPQGNINNMLASQASMPFYPSTTNLSIPAQRGLDLPPLQTTIQRNAIHTQATESMQPPINHPTQGLDILAQAAAARRQNDDTLPSRSAENTEPDNHDEND
eukprot:scaffold35012_cov214-Amphora_coffeaeformis.AAC.3